MIFLPFVVGFVSFAITGIVVVYIWSGGVGVSIYIEKRDMWIGFYYDDKKDILYFCPFPCVVVRSKPIDGSQK